MPIILSLLLKCIAAILINDEIILSMSYLPLSLHLHSTFIIYFICKVRKTSKDISSLTGLGPPASVLSFLSSKGLPTNSIMTSPIGCCTELLLGR